MTNSWGHRHYTGFTIVELLIVIVVIAVLAAITIAAYTGVQNRANDSSVQADLRTISKKLELARVDDANAYYPTNNTTIAAAIPGVKVAKSSYATTPDVSYNLLFCWPSIATPRDYALLATSKSGKRFYIRTTGAVTEYTGAVSWADANISAMCGSVIAGSSASGAGYSSGDTTTGPWRSWASS